VCWILTGWVPNITEFLVSFVGDGTAGCVGVDGAEWVVGGVGLGGVGEEVEEGGFSDVGEAYDSHF